MAAALHDIQAKLASMMSTSNYKNLPKGVQRRVKALKKLQLESARIEADFYAAVHALECKYAARNDSNLDRRRNIVNGAVEPTDQEADWPYSREEVTNDPAAPTKGIASFWSTALKNVDVIASMIEAQDELILESLRDIRVVMSESPMGFTLEFHFAPNEYFSDEVLTKWYEMKSEPDEEDPFSFEGLETVTCRGHEIKWRPGKDVTAVEKQINTQNKKTGDSKVITKKSSSRSFFNFFNPPAAEGDMDEKKMASLRADFELGRFIKDSLVPQAVSYFTGLAVEDDGYGEN